MFNFCLYHPLKKNYVRAWLDSVPHDKVKLRVTTKIQGRGTGIKTVVSIALDPSFLSEVCGPGTRVHCFEPHRVCVFV